VAPPPPPPSPEPEEEATQEPLDFLFTLPLSNGEPQTQAQSEEETQEPPQAGMRCSSPRPSSTLGEGALEEASLGSLEEANEAPSPKHRENSQLAPQWEGGSLLQGTTATSLEEVTVTPATILGPALGPALGQAIRSGALA